MLASPLRQDSRRLVAFSRLAFRARLEQHFTSLNVLPAHSRMSAPDGKPSSASPGEPAAQRNEWIARVIVVAAAALTFARGVGGPLVESWDDGRILVDSELVQRISLDTFVAIWSGPHHEAYQPLHLLSYWLDVPWAGPSGPVIHAVSLALWCGALLVVLALMRRLELALVPAVLATLFFGLHTIQVEVVTWATGRKDILAIGFTAGSVLAHLGSERWNDRRAWASRALYVLAALSKTTVLPLPLVLFTADVVLRKRDPRSAAIAQAPALVIGLGLGLLVLGIWATNELIRESPGATSSALLVLATYAHHLGTALFPADVSPLYPLARDQAPSAGLALLGSGVLVAAIGVAWRMREHLLARRVLFGLLAFVVLLAPVSNVVPVYFQWQDRYLALPLLGLAFALGAVLDALRSRRAALAVAAALVAVLAVRTAVYQEAWGSERALWEHAVRVQPRAFYAWLKLGEVRRDAGDHDRALRAYERAIEIAPQLRLGHAAFLSALLLRDEARGGLEPSRAQELAARFLRQMDDPIALRELAGELAATGYRDGVTHVLARSLDIAPIADDRLERAAAAQLSRGNEWLARFYLSRMGRAPVLPEIQAYLARERERRQRGETPDAPEASEAPTGGADHTLPSP